MKKKKISGRHFLKLAQFLRKNKNRIFLSFIDKDTEGTREGDEIFLNIDLLIAHTLIHEFLHAEDPDRSERRVEILTEKIMRELSDEECKNIGRLILKYAKRKKYQN